MPVSAIAAAIALFAGLLPCRSFAQENYSAWSDALKIVINTSSNGANITATVTGIPLLVRLNPTVFNGFAKTQPKGADIRFANAKGTPLPYQIERWVDGNNNNDTAEIWVRLDTVLGSDNTQYFQMRFGNAAATDNSNGAAVFDSLSGYIGAWHLGETPDTAAAGLRNASRNAFHGKPKGSITAGNSVAGVIGKAMNFNGSSDFVTFGDINAIDSASSLMVALWFKATQLRDWSAIINKSESNANGWYISENGGSYNGSDDFLVAARNNGSGTSQDGATNTSLIPTGAWMHCVMAYDGAQSSDATRLRFYVNGAEQSLAYRPAIPAILPATAAEVQIAKSFFENVYFYGAIDEPEIIRGARPAAWVKLSYETQKPDANCLSFQSLDLPGILAQTPARDTAITQGLPLTFSVTVSSASTVSYAWYKNGGAMAGMTAASFTIASIQFSDTGSYSCRVTNTDGAILSVPVRVTVTAAPTPPVITAGGQPRDTMVLEGAPWSMAVTAAGEPTLAYQWYKDSVIPADTVTGQRSRIISFPSARLSDAGNYRCVISNTFGACTSNAAALSVAPNNRQITNPILVTGTRIDSTHVTVRISRFKDLPLTPPDQFFPWSVDTVLVWYRINQDPAGTNLADPNLIKFPLARLIATGKDNYDSTVTVAKIGCQDYCFKGSVRWIQSQSTVDSIPPLGGIGSGDTVHMCDTSRLVNPLKFSFEFALPSDSTVRVTLSGFTAALGQIDLLSSLVLRYSVGGSSFIDSSIPKSAFPSVSGDSITLTVKDPRFAGEESWSQWQAFFKGVNNNGCDTARDSCRIGVPRPVNTAFLKVDTALATQANLSWTAAGTFDRFRIWHGTLPVPDSSFPSGQYSVDTFPGTASSGVIRGLEQKTRYYCGLQVERYRRWSLVTPAARCTLTTDTILDDAPIANTADIDTVELDTVMSKIRVIWHVDTVLPAMINAGVTWHGEGGAFPVPAAANTRFNARLGGLPDTLLIAVDGLALEFGRSYYFGIWLQKDQGLWSPPAATSTGFFTIPQPKVIRVVLFRNDVRIVSVFGGAVVLRMVDVVETQSVLRTIDLPFDGAGLVKVSPLSLDFTPGTTTPITIMLGMRYETDSIPTGCSVNDIRMYRFDTTHKVWLVDTTTLTRDSAGAPILTMKVTFDNCIYPFVLAIDTIPPSLTVLGDTSSVVEPKQPIAMSLRVTDNIANPAVMLHAGQGCNRFSLNDTLRGMESLGETAWEVPPDMVQGESGIRIWFVASDGRLTQKADVSRDISIFKSDNFIPEWERWTPLGATAILDTPAMKQALDEFGAGDASWKYDIYTMRLFRYDKNDWREYSEDAAGTFAFVPGRVIWLKTRVPRPMDFGSGRSVSLKEPYVITLPAKSWTDFCLPFRFDIHIGDLLDLLPAKVASALQFYRWKNGTGGNGGYTAEGFYLPLNQNAGSRTSVMRYRDSSTNKVAFTVWNALDSTVELRIPPIPTILSAVTAKRAAPATGEWSIAVRPRTADELLSPVFCAHNQVAGGVVASPLPPGWSRVRAGISDERYGRMLGNLVVNETNNGGFSCRLDFENGNPEATTVSYAIERLTGAESAIVVIDPCTGAAATNPDALSIEVPGNGCVYRILAIGSIPYCEGIAGNLKKIEFALARITPNPFHDALQIEFIVPYEGIERVRCAIINQLGRVIADIHTGSRAHPGYNRITWTQKGCNGLAAGAYFIRLTGFDGKGRIVGERLSKILYLP
jgi:hypothetical protein